MGSGIVTAEDRPYRECDCGAVVWDGRLPKYSETVVCPGCGQDHSRAMPLPQVLRYAWGRFRKWRRHYGWIGVDFVLALKWKRWVWAEGTTDGRRWRRGPYLPYGVKSFRVHLSEHPGALRHDPRPYFQYRPPWTPSVPYETPDYTVAPPEPITLLDGRVVQPGQNW